MKRDKPQNTPKPPTDPAAGATDGNAGFNRWRRDSKDDDQPQGSDEQDTKAASGTNSAPGRNPLDANRNR